MTDGSYTVKGYLRRLEAELIRTFLEGHRVFRPDLPYPESVSDCQGGMRAVLKRFDVVERAVPIDLADMLPARERSDA